MAEEHASVRVPYLLNELAQVAEKTLNSLGLGWKLTGDVRQYSYIKDQTPAPGYFVPKGSTVTLHVANGPLP